MNKIRNHLNQIVFGTDTKAGRNFDVFLLWVILLSVIVVMLESVPELDDRFDHTFFVLEWVLTFVFTIEYGLRIWISPKPVKYISSLWGIIDLLSILPTYISFVLLGYHYLLVVRIFRLLRIFRILKLVRFNNESKILMNALKSSRYKITIFLFAVIAIVVFLGTIMYVVEGGREGFTSIPHSIYWAIVTVTTVGYGDATPHTIIGKFIASVAMILGYSIIAVPTGIMTASLSNMKRSCSHCNNKNPDYARYCNSCGHPIVD